MESSVWISLRYATFIITISGGRVTDAPPIARWCVGKQADDVIRYFRKRGARIVTNPEVKPMNHREEIR